MSANLMCAYAYSSGELSERKAGGHLLVVVRSTDGVGPLGNYPVIASGEGERPCVLRLFGNGPAGSEVSREPSPIYDGLVGYRADNLTSLMRPVKKTIESAMESLQSDAVAVWNVAG